MNSSDVSCLQRNSNGKWLKQHAIFDFANNSHADFVCLQETLMSDDSLISAYSSKWNDPGF